MKVKISIISFLFFTTIVFGQVDSLYNVIKVSKIDSVIANSHYELGWSLKFNDLQSAKAHTDSALVIFKGLKSPKRIALCHFQFSILARISGNYKKALASLDKYQLYVESVKDTNNIAFVFFEKGVVFAQIGDHKNGLIQFYKALNITEKSKNLSLSGSIYNSIGIIYSDIERYPEAIKSFNKVIDLYKEIEIGGENYGDVYLNLGDVYKLQKNYVKAQEYYNMSLRFYEEAESEWGISLVNMNLGLILTEKKKFKEAIPFLNKAYKIQKANDYKTDLALTLSNLGKLHSEMKNYSKSEAFLNEGLALKSDSKSSTRELYFEMYRLNQKQSNYKQALHYHKNHVIYKDSIFNENNLKSINFLKTQFETEKKDKEIIQQQLELEQKDKEIQKKKTQNNYMIGLTSFLLVASILTWFLFQQRQKRKNQEIVTLKIEHQIKSLELLIEGEEKERLRIAKELHDGVNGDLSAIKYKLTSMQEMSNKIINEAVEMIDKSCKQVRAISHNLIPPSLDSFNIIEATETFCQNMNAIHASNINFHHIGEIPNINKKDEINIFRIIQELVTNSIKHADATEIDVQLSCREKQIQITVEDNGKGFDKESIEDNGIGLQNINSRVDYLHATMDLLSNNKGTSYTIEIDTIKLNDN
ncbi:tetratricopeptide repeat-containing sensor histidine kinase [Psychroserpens sp.]